METILQLVITMLSDRKLEVAQLAALSLSGLLKALPASSVDALRQRYLEAAKGVKPAKRVKLAGPGLGTPNPDACLTLGNLACSQYVQLSFGEASRV